MRALIALWGQIQDAHLVIFFSILSRDMLRTENRTERKALPGTDVEFNHVES